MLAFSLVTKPSLRIFPPIGLCLVLFCLVGPGVPRLWRSERACATAWVCREIERRSLPVATSWLSVLTRCFRRHTQAVWV
jgi:hypothetical protein